MGKRLLPLATILLLGYHSVFAQNGWKLSIIGENGQNFYVHVGSQSFSSSSGHLTIPQLHDSTYELVVGFPGEQYPPQKFTISMGGKNQDFVLKNLADKSWALYNSQTKETKMARPENSPAAETFPGKSVKKDDAFSRLMAAVVNDTAVLYTTYAAEDELKDSVKQNGNPVASPKKDSIVAEADIKDSSRGVVETAAAPEPKSNKPKPPKSKIAAMAPAVRKLSERRLTTALQLRFLDLSAKGTKDTVTILIPYEKKAARAGSATGQTGQQGIERKDSAGQAPTEAVPQNDSSGANQLEGIKQSNKNNSAEFSDCKTLATDYDVDVLRVNILTANTENDKIAVAEKAFKSMCVSVRQVKALSELFASDKSRLRFYVTAYPHVSDRDHFGQLQETLTDSSYSEKFRKLVGGE